MQSSQSKIELFYVTIFGLLAGIFVIWLTGALKAASGYQVMIFVIVTIAIFAWTVRGGNNWWVVFPVGASLGGVFWVGFKIYPGEIGLLLASMALIFSIVIKGKNFRQDRSKISWAFSLLIIYFTLHMLASLYTAKFGLMSGG